MRKRRERKRVSEKEWGRERVGEREWERERDVKYGCFIFIFNMNDGCVSTF